jgi:hypothetical protein
VFVSAQTGEGLAQLRRVLAREVLSQDPGKDLGTISPESERELAE